MLVDSQGCPTDVNIMGFVSKSPNLSGAQAQSAPGATGIQSSGRALEIPFDAFKFPTSDTVQFRALVTPCLHACDPVFCVASNYDGRQLEQNSYGRRRRRSIANSFYTPEANGASSSTPQKPTNHHNSGASSNEEELVLVQSIKILDTFEQERLAKQRKGAARSNDLDSNDLSTAFVSEESQLARLQLPAGATGCLNLAGLSVAFVLFLFLQVILLLCWAVCWMRRGSIGRTNGSVGSTDSILGRLSAAESAVYHGYSNGAYLSSAQSGHTGTYKSGTIKSSMERPACYLNAPPSTCPSPASFTKTHR